MKRLPIILLACGMSVVLMAQTQETLDYAMIGKIRDEGLRRSQVMDHVSWLSDVYGPRLTGSPAIQQAADWVMKRFAEWGLVNIHQEKWAFGKGWALVHVTAHMISPQIMPIIAVPKAWTPGTNGTVTADVVQVAIRSDADFEKYRGKLAGKIVLTQPAREVRMLEGPVVLRMSEADIREAETVPVPPLPAPSAPTGAQSTGGQSLARRIDRFLRDEGVVATFDRGSDRAMSAGGSDLSWLTQRTDGGTVFPIGEGSRGADAGSGLPSATLAVEHYNRMVRVLDKGVAVKVELDIQTRFFDETDKNGFNIIADLPGTDLANEVLMIGAHLDSVGTGAGATDNATGSAVMMEVLRILKAVAARPRRTIRIGLWGGEEEGLLGSKAYVAEHLGDPTTMVTKPEHAQLAAYFNNDNGSGRIRGVWLQENLAVRPIFEAWLQPLRDLGVTTLGPRSVAATDHASFDAVGLPAFQFMVDRLEYNSRTHHSNMDFVDRVQRDDLVQAATVTAVFAYNAAMRDAKLPRKAMPAPKVASGFE